MGFVRKEYCSGLPCPPLGDLLNPGIEPRSLNGSRIGRLALSLPLAPSGKPYYELNSVLSAFVYFFLYSLLVCMLSSFSRVRLCNPMDYGPPGSSVHGILQARILEWVAMPSSRGPSGPRDQTHISCSSRIAGGFFTTEPVGEAPLYFHS